ncbi:unnamed protein product [Jaminaea pallidilutea]
MDPLFSGSIAPQRKINLGGDIGGPSSASQLAAQARSSRQARDLMRRQELSAARIQSSWRGSSVRASVRQQRRQEYLAALQGGALTKTESPQDAEQATRTLLAALGNARAKRTNRDPASDDEELLSQWCQHVMSQSPDSSDAAMTVLLQKSPEVFARQTLAVVSQMGLRLVHHASSISASHQSTFLRFFDFSLSASIPGHHKLALEILSSDFVAVVAGVVQALPASRKGDATLVELASGLLLRPFQLLSSRMQPDVDLSLLRQQTLHSWAQNILGMPALPSRLPVLSFAKLAASFPLSELTPLLASQTLSETSAKGPPQAVDTLANLLALGSQRVPHLSSGVDLKNYLAALVTLQTRVGPTVFASVEKDASTSKRTVQLDADTAKRLSILPSSKHLGAIFALSARFSASTRPALYAFLCSVLSAWPTDSKNQVLNAVLYGVGDSAHQGAGQGPVRELWRGYVRGSSVARRLGTVSAGGLDVKVFKEASDAWASIVLLSELYSRLLLTLGDDEFFPSRAGNATSSAVGSSSAGGLGGSGNVVAARNPLTLDEVTDLSALVRNLAFALYWHLEVPVAPGSGGPLPGVSNSSAIAADTSIPGLAYTASGLRDLATRLLQQLHARDARHRFTPDEFWLMTDEMDINSFVESVMLEEEKLAQEQADGESSAAGPTADDEGDVEEDEVPLLPSLPRSARPSKQHISARKLAFISPRLGILNNLPFVIPFATRIKIFRTFIYRDAVRLRIDRSGFMSRRRRVTIRRDHISEDGMAQLNGLGSALKESIEIVFLDQWGFEEAGIDGGGVFKEFLTSLVREAFDTDRGLWRATDQQELFPNPSSYARQSEQLQWYSFLGRVLGKALYEGILVDVRFASFFLSKWLGTRSRGMNHLDDLASLDSLDSELYRGLIYLKNYAGDVEADLSLNFTVSDDEFGVQKVTELVPNGANIPVTNKNRLGYIFLVANYRLDAQIRAQCSAFFAGLSELIDPRWLRIFDQVELQRLIKGSEDPIDVDDLQANTVYSEYHEKDLTIQYFWQAVQSFDQATRASLLKFVTSCPSPPLLGFAQLNPKFCIRLSSEDEQRLPSSSTCVNLLKLPRYSTFEICREKVLTAIRSGAGFDLS